MYEENTSLATFLMDTETRVWGIYCSPLDFAYENLKLNVVAHPCSQQSMTSQWNNELSPDTLFFLKVIRKWDDNSHHKCKMCLWVYLGL